MMECRPLDDLPTVLHVVESFGGGVAAAVCGIVDGGHQASHHLAYSLRHGVADLSLAESRFESTMEFKAGLLSGARSLKRLCRELQPDLVHSHSSWAGMYMRAAGVDCPVIYSPHCFAFNRTDVRSATRRLFLLAERLLVGRTAAVLANGTFEEALARSLGHTIVASFPMLSPGIGSSGGIGELAAPSSSLSRDSFRVATVGRWCPQKSPQFFADVCGAVAEIYPGKVDFQWLGAPDFGLKPEDDLPYRISGWLDHQSLLTELRQVDLVVHTAEWEAGIPLAVLEALSMSKPVLIRELASAPELRQLSYVTPAGMATALARLAESPAEELAAQRLSRAIWQQILARNGDFDLIDFYRTVLRTHPRRKRFSWAPRTY